METLTASGWNWLLTAAGLLIACLVWREARLLSYWRRRGIRGPTPLPLFGNTLDKLWHVVPQREVQYVREYGRVCGLMEMRRPVLNIADPVILRDVLIRDFESVCDRPVKSHNHLTKLMLNGMRGEEWRRSRITLSPLFSSGSMRSMLPVMQSCADSLTQAVDRLIGERTEALLDTKHAFGCYTMDSICCSAFSTQTNAHTDHGPGSFVHHTFRMLSFPLRRLLPLFLLPVWLLDLLNYTPNDPAASRFLEQAIREIVRQSRTSSSSRPNLLQQMIALSQRSGAEGQKFLTEQEMIANAVLFLFAGYDSTSTAISFGFYALAAHPDVQQRLRDEVVRVLGPGQQADWLQYDKLTDMTYLDAFVNETLRMYTPIVRYQREVSRDYAIPSLGLCLKKGDVVRIPVYAIHHCADFYPDPETFDPQRFLPANRHRLVPYTFLPFGVGPRMCLGTRLALLTIKLAVVNMLRSFSFRTCDQPAVPPDLSSSQITLKCKNLNVRVSRLTEAQMDVVN